MSENFLKDLWRKTFLYRARGVSVARGMGSLFFYPCVLYTSDAADE